MKKVITYGTFDLFHQGHYNILKRAKDLGDYLIVGVTGESYDLERGKINVRDSLIQRIENVRKTGLADEIIVEEYQGQKVDDILKYNIDIFVVGSDWIGKFDYLKKYCTVKYLERTKDISSTELRNREKFFKIGILTDSINDNDIVYESKFVSGVHIDSVFSENNEVASSFAKKYEINKSYTNYEEFLDDVDIVYISIPFEKRYGFVKNALQYGKYVICASPITMNQLELKELFDIAHEKGVLIIEDIITAYLRAFNQLVWLINGNLIGQIISLNAEISSKEFANKKSIEEILVYPLLFIDKLLGSDYISTKSNRLAVDSESEVFKSQIEFSSALATISIYEGLDYNSCLTILGTNGKIVIEDDWWNTGYFEAWINGEKNKKRYSFNFEGNGFRYLLQELLIMIKDNRNECTRLFDKDSLQLIENIRRITK